MMRIIHSSDGISIHFTSNKMYSEYHKEHLELDKRYYRKIREENGIWASNQNKFVPNKEMLKEWDSRYMENLVS